MLEKRFFFIPLSLMALFCCDFGGGGWTAGETTEGDTGVSASDSWTDSSGSTSIVPSTTDGSESDAEPVSTTADTLPTTTDNTTAGSTTTSGTTTQSGETEGTGDPTGTTESEDTTSTDSEDPTDAGTDSDDTNDLPEICEGDSLSLNFKCDPESVDSLFIEVPGETVAPNTTVDIDLPISECGDGTRAAAGFVARVRLKDACMWSMRMSLVCPAGSELELTSPDGCSEDCAVVPGVFDAIFQTTGASSCFACNLMNGECNRQPSGEQNWNICGFLQECFENSDQPWKLRVEAGDSEVQVESVALEMALRSM